MFIFSKYYYYLQGKWVKPGSLRTKKSCFRHWAALYSEVLSYCCRECVKVGDAKKVYNGGFLLLHRRIC
jgi:hypothetical protein